MCQGDVWIDKSLIFNPTHILIYKYKEGGDDTAEFIAQEPSPGWKVYQEGKTLGKVVFSGTTERDAREGYYDTFIQCEDGKWYLKMVWFYSPIYNVQCLRLEALDHAAE